MAFVLRFDGTIFLAMALADEYRSAREIMLSGPITLPVLSVGMLSILVLMYFASRTVVEFVAGLLLMLSLTFGMMGLARVDPPGTFDRWLQASQPYLSLVLLGSGILALRSARRSSRAMEGAPETAEQSHGADGGNVGC